MSTDDLRMPGGSLMASQSMTVLDKRGLARKGKIFMLQCFHFHCGLGWGRFVVILDLLLEFVIVHISK